MSGCYTKKNIMITKLFLRLYYQEGTDYFQPGNFSIFREINGLVATKTALIVCLLFTVAISYGQNEAAYWYFGSQAGIHFDAGGPTVLTDGQMDQLEGCSTISTPEGELLFYTEGWLETYNANHVQLFNSEELDGSWSSSQAALIVRRPQSEIYYLFTTGHQGGQEGTGGLQYSVVDMALDGGMGGVVFGQKNISLYGNTCEKLTAVYHENGEDVWVIAHRNDSDEFTAYLITATGLDTTPVTSAVGKVNALGNGNGAIGYMKASPDGKKIASGIYLVNPGLELFDFNNATGSVTNAIEINTFSIYGVEFSPDSKLLYCTANSLGTAGEFGNDFPTPLYQYDITSGSQSAIQASEINIAPDFKYSALQLGIDGKLYALNTSIYPYPSLESMSVVNNPMITGTACNFVDSQIDLEGRQTQYGLPGFNQSFFRFNLDFKKECAGEPIQMKVLTHCDLIAAQWDFGDPFSGAANSSTEIEPEHTYSAAGTYTVSAKVTTSVGYVITIVDTVTALAAPTINNPGDLLFCDEGNDGIETYNLNNLSNVVLGGQDPTTYEVSYHTSLEDAEVGNSPIGNPFTITLEEQTVYACLTNIETDCRKITSFIAQAYAIADESEVFSIETCGESAGILLDFTQFEPQWLGGQDSDIYTFTYYNDPDQAEAGVDPIEEPTAYPATPGSYYVSIANTFFPDCFRINEFVVIENAIPAITPVIADFQLCDINNPGDLMEVFNLELMDVEILGGQQNVTVSYYSSEENASLGQDVLPTAYESAGDEIWVRLENDSTGCYAIGSFNLVVIPVPPIPIVTDVAVCDAYILPEFLDGSHYESATGESIPANTEITQTQTITLITQSGTTPNCTSQADFTVTINQTPATPIVADVTACDTYTLPNLPPGSTYNTESGGTGSVLDENSDITTTQQIWVIAETGTIPNCISEASFTVTINYSPAVPTVSNISACDSYVLPGLPAGSHYESATGLLIAENTEITESQVITVVAESGTLPECSSRADFTVTINETPIVGNFDDVTSCGGYELPALAVGNYYGQPNGQGTLYPAGTVIGQNQTVYVYAQTGTTPNCFTQDDFTITILSPPVANPTPAALQVCDPNNDCFAAFDLSIATADITGGVAGYTVTYYETAEDAQTGYVENQLQSPYANIDPCIQTIYARMAFDDSGCVSFSQLQLIVNPTPQGFEATQLFECDTNGDGIENFDLEAAIPTILNGLDPNTTTVLFYQNEADVIAVNNNIQGTLSYQSIGGTIWATVTNSSTGCFDVVPIELTVRPVPTVPQPVPAFSKCDETGDDQAELFDLTSQYLNITQGQVDLTVTFYVNQQEALAGENEIGNTTAYPNSPAVQTLWIRVEDPFTGCFSITTMDLRVEPLPNPIIPSPVDPLLNICDDNQDGYSTFDLTALIPDMQQGVPPNEMIIHFYDTETEAELQLGEIEDPAHYANVYPFAQVIWIGALNTLTGCYRIITITINVLPAPIGSYDVPDLSECDELTDTQDGITYFDLAQQDALILSAQSGTGYEVEYFLTEAAAEEGTSPIIPANQYIGTDGQKIWFRVQNFNTDCFNVNFFTLVVNLPLNVPTSLGKWEVCDDDLPTPGLPTLTWDLTQIDIPEISPSDVVTYYPGYQNALAGTNPFTDEEVLNFTNADNPQNIGISITSAAGCVAVTSMTISVLPLPSVQDITNRPLHECDDDANSGTENFDLTQNQTYMANGDEDNLNFEYYLTQAAAENQTPSQQIATPETHTSATGSIWIRVEKTTKLSSEGEYCYIVMEQQLIVDPIPQLHTPVQTLYGCETDGNHTAEFNLNDANEIVLTAGQSVEGISFSYYLTQADAANHDNEINNYTGYTNTSDPQTIYVVATFEDTECFSIGSFLLDVEDGAIANDPGLIAAVCADQGNTHTFDLVTMMESAILGAQVAPQYTVSYYATEMDALTSSNPIVNPADYDTASATIYAVVTNMNSHKPCTSDPMPMVLTVEPLLDLTVNGGNALCIDFLTGATQGVTLSVSGIEEDELNNYSYQWFLDGTETGDTTSTIIASLGGSYTVVTTSNSLDCVSASPAFEVTDFTINPDINYIVSGAFQDNQSIVVNVEGTNTQQVMYSMDDGPYTPNNVFTNLSMGSHTVSVQTPCGDFTIEVSLINYPHYFTPNDDGYHDTWNITGLENDKSAMIYIFDRYGKLLKQINPAGVGWDGTYTGRKMPSTDYWFLVNYSENGTDKEFGAHFSLKR